MSPNLKKSTQHQFLEWSLYIFRDGILLCLADDLLCSSMSEQLCYYLIPSISEHIPLPSLLKALLNCHHMLHNTLSVWTLYSVLLISDHWIGETYVLWNSLLLFLKLFENFTNIDQFKVLLTLLSPSLINILWEDMSAKVWV